MGWEQLEYEENEPDKNLDSNAKVTNVIIGIEGLKRWESLFAGIKAVIPVFLYENEETWKISGTMRQTNSLEYGWERIDAYIGFPSSSFFNPYGGLRWSESKQTRMNFVVHGIAASGTAIEKINSWSLFLGLRGNGNFTTPWKWNYWIEYFIPVHNNVTNSALSGFEVSDKEGYTLELKCGVGYSYNKALSFGLLIYGGRMHWDGSGWKPFSGRLIKWPENNTDYLGGTLSITWKFGKRVPKINPEPDINPLDTDMLLFNKINYQTRL